MRIDGDLKETLHIALKQFTDPTGKINYVIARTSGEVPWVKGQLNWLALLVQQTNDPVNAVLADTNAAPAPSAAWKAYLD